MTPEQEDRLINRFKEYYDAFPEGDLQKRVPPLPDYTIETPSGVIGIELTEMFHSQVAKQQSSFKNTITDLVVEELTKLLHFKFSLDVHPQPEGRISKQEISKLAKEIARLCYYEFRTLSDLQTVSIEHIELDLRSKEYAAVKKEIMSKGYRNLPPGIERIVITRHDGVGESWNAQSEAAIIPNVTEDQLRIIMNKKEKLRYNYVALKE